MGSLNEFEKRVIDKLKRELGSIIMEALNNPKVIEIMLNSDGYLWVEEMGQPMQKLGAFPEGQALALIGTIASFIGATVNPEKPILECELPIDGSRFAGVIPPIVKSTTFTIRKKATSIFTLENYAEKKILTLRQIEVIKTAIKDRKNILIVGGTGSGKTTLTNAIIDAIVDLTPFDRIVIIEDTAELQCKAENANIFRTTENTSLISCLKLTMRMRPDRILVGEVRGGEALGLLKAWNTGHPGGVATIHANNAYGGLIRMEQLISEATTAPMGKLIAEAVNIVIFIEKTGGGNRRVKEIAIVEGYDPTNQTYQIKQI